MKWILSKITSREFLLYAANGAITALLYAALSAALVLYSPLKVGVVVMISQITATAFHFLGSHYVFSLPINTIGGKRILRYSLSVLLNWVLTISCGVLIAQLSGSKLLGALFAPVVPTIINYPILKLFVFRKASN